MNSSLRLGETDFCLLLTSNIARETDLKIETFIRSPRRLWISKGHPLLSKAVIHLADIASLPFLLLDTDEYPDVIRGHWHTHGGQPNVAFTTTSFETVRSLVAKGRGVTLLSDLVYRPWSLEGLRVMRRTVEDCTTYMDVGAVLSETLALSEPAAVVLDYLRVMITRHGEDA